MEMVGLSFCTKFDWGSYSVTVAKSTSQKIETLIRSEVFSNFRLISINLSFRLALKAVVFLGYVS